MKKLHFTILILTIYNISYGQIKRKIVDAESKERIPFVNIWVENEDIGTISNEDGFFMLQNIADTKIIVFSATGYVTKKINFKLIENTVVLTPQIIELNEVIVNNVKKQKKENVIDKMRNSKIRHYLPGFGKPYIFAKYFDFKDEYQKTPYLKELRIRTRTEIDESNFIVHLYKINEEGAPEGYLHDKNIIVTTKQGTKTLSINISHLNIEFPENGFFVAVEWILTKDNSDVFDSFEPYIGFTHQESNENSWFYRFGVWNRVKAYNGEVFPKTTFKQLGVELTLTN
tara:strand:- start:12 stop:869 length:858 start_codon:yes stop_codon:yes gene_type:complete